MGGGRLSLLLTVALLGMTVLCNPISNRVNETETEDFLEDALGSWLENFGTYTFMVEQDVDDNDDEGIEELVPEESNAFADQYGEEAEEDYDQGSSAPIALTIKRTGGLLNPDLDYKVKLESLIAEGGSVLVTLRSFGNKTMCGVGGFSLPPEFQRRVGPEGRLNINHQRDGNRSTTIVAFAVDTEEEETTTTWTVGDEGSAWEELGQNLWWITGKLGGGGLLTLTFTPPECGCLMLRAHYALPLGDNLTLVVGPEAYPMDLETLLCVDPAYLHNIKENLIEPELELETLTQDDLEEPTHLQETDNDLDSPDSSIQQTGRGRGRWGARKAKRDRKRKRQEARQSIRQAGRRVSKQRMRKQMRLQRRGNETADILESRQDSPPNGRHGDRWARKKARKAARKQAKQAKQAKQTWKGKKPWKKHRKHASKNGHRNRQNRRNRHNRNQNTTEDVTPPRTEAFEDHLDEDEDHFNSTEPQTDEDVVADILLAEEEEPEEVVNTVNSVDASTRRRGRKHHRQRGRTQHKGKNKDKKKGVKFCCKQGIKLKKSQLLVNNTIDEDQAEVLCNNTNDIITTFAEHHFGMNSVQCSSRFEDCCSQFTLQLWENIKVKKGAKKAKRKQQRKARRQSRKQLRHSSTPPTSSVTQ